MKTVRALALAAAILAPGAALAQGMEECRVLVGKEWIEMGHTTLAGCLKFADEAGDPGERQFAKLGRVFLKIQGDEHFQSLDGGNSWIQISEAAPVSGFESLNVLQAPQDGLEDQPRRASPKKRQRRPRRSP